MLFSLRVNVRHLAGKRDSRLHSTTGFSENDVVRKRGYQILGVQHLINQALFFLPHSFSMYGCRMEFDFPMIFNSQQDSILKAASKSAKAMIKYL